MINDISSKAFADLGAPSLVYVRAVRADELGLDAPLTPRPGIQPAPTRSSMGSIPPDGEPLAVLNNREEAFAAARAYELAPVSVH
jgi:hypothetical protein